MLTAPPFPAFPSRVDWEEAQAIAAERLQDRWSSVHADPLGYLAAVARNRMRTRHCRTSAYTAFLAECDRQRRAAEQAAEEAARRRRQAMTDKERAEEAAFLADGGTAIEWAIELEARAETKAQATKKRAIARTRSNARTTNPKGTQ